MGRLSKLFRSAGNPKGLWKRYVVAIVLIGGLLTTTHVAASMALEASAKNAVLVNMSGRQRMLSQRILFLSLQAADHNETGVKGELKASIELFSNSQIELSQQPDLSAELLQLYGASGQLNQRVQDFSALATKIAIAPAGDTQALLKLLEFDRDRLLRDLDQAVTEFEAIADRDAARLDTVQDISFYSAILILLIEALFIFAPAQLTVSNSISRLETQSATIMQAKMDVVKRNQELETLKDQVEYEAMHDALTGLPNRRALQLSMEDLRKLAKKSDHVISVMHIDLDRFKLINDTLGHAAGDHVLQHVAKTLRQCTRKGDIVARVGGDEFVILPELNATPEELSDRSERIIAAMRKPIPYNDSVCHFGASIGIGIGISRAKSTTVDPSELLVKADIALYRAKELGRGRYEFFSEELAVEVEEAKKTSDALIAAFDRGEFSVNYQPLFCAKTRKITSVEALARWNHPEYGLKTAGSFLHQVESLGLTAELDKIVLKEVEKDIAHAKAANCPFPRVAINVSASSLLRSDFIDRVIRSDLPRHGLALEISESVDFDSDISTIIEKLAAVRSHGVDVEIDDFGTGHASIFSFQKIRPARIKIARELITDIETSSETRQMTHSICRLAESFGAEIIAEGIETASMADAVSQIGCDYLQGFGLSRPKGFEQLIYELQLSEKNEAAAIAS